MDFLSLAPQIHAQAVIKDANANPGMNAQEIAQVQAEASRRASSSSTVTASDASTSSSGSAPLGRFLKLSPGGKLGDWTTVVEDEATA